MKVLAIDTSSMVATCAIMDDEKLIGEYILNHKKTHSQKIMPMIEEILSSCELKPEDIDLYGVAKGPGSFTGLRIGIATIKALAHVNNKPVVGVSTLDALAFNIPFGEGVIVPIMDAKRDRVFTAMYKWENGSFYVLEEPEVIEVDKLIEKLRKRDELIIFNGDGTLVYKERLLKNLGNKVILASKATNMARASSVAELALAKAQEGKTESYMELMPDYMRKSQAEREYEKKVNSSGEVRE